MAAPKHSETQTINPLAKTHDWVKVMSPSGKTKFAWVPKQK